MTEEQNPVAAMEGWGLQTHQHFGDSAEKSCVGS